VLRELRNGPRPVAPGFWDHPPLRQAATDRHMGRLIAAYRSHPAHGPRISQEIVGTWVNKSQAQICKIETGSAMVNLADLRDWARLLRVPRSLLWFDPRPAKTVSRAGRTPERALPAAVLPPGQDLTVAQTWLTHLVNVAALAPKIGWRALHPLVTQQLAAFDTLRAWQPEMDGPLAAADARWSEFMSWVCANGGFPGAEMWLDRAQRYAVQADDPAMIAYVAMRHAQNAVDSRDAPAAVTWSRRALDSHPDLPSRTAALCLSRLAEGLALTGSDDSLTAVSSARDLARTPPGTDSADPAGHCDERYVDAVHARCLYLLGEHAEATARFADLLGSVPAGDDADVGVWTAYFAETRAVKDAELGAHAGLQALDLVAGSGSARVVKALSPVAVTLRPYRNSPVVSDFLTRYRLAATAGMTPSAPWI
jgi:hypothetical protein